MTEALEAKCIDFLVRKLAEKSDHAPPFYHDQSKSEPSEQTLLDHMAAKGWITMNPYVRPLNGFARHGVFEVSLTQKGMSVLQAKTTVTTTTTQTVQTEFMPQTQELFPDTPYGREKLRSFKRTERGFFISNYDGVDAMLSGLQSDMKAVKKMSLPVKERKTHQYFVKYTLGLYWNQIPEHLRHEAEDCRDLAILPGRKRNGL
jgi:hypothetical protein